MSSNNNKNRSYNNQKNPSFSSTSSTSSSQASHNNKSHYRNNRSSPYKEGRGGRGSSRYHNNRRYNHNSRRYNNNNGYNTPFKTTNSTNSTTNNNIISDQEALVLFAPILRSSTGTKAQELHQNFQDGRISEADFMKQVKIIILNHNDDDNNNETETEEAVMNPQAFQDKVTISSHDSRKQQETFMEEKKKTPTKSKPSSVSNNVEQQQQQQSMPTPPKPPTPSAHQPQSILPPPPGVPIPPNKISTMNTMGAPTSNSNPPVVLNKPPGIPAPVVQSAPPPIVPAPLPAPVVPIAPTIRTKRFTRNQPGTLTLNFPNINRDCLPPSQQNQQQQQQIIQLKPRSELIVQWQLPLTYLRSRPHTQKNKNISIKQALEGVTIGLFRLGSPDNLGSIIAKNVLSSSSNAQAQVHVMTNEIVCGQLPFYAPRSPGNVIFRLFIDTNTNNNNKNSQDKQDNKEEAEEEIINENVRTLATSLPLKIMTRYTPETEACLRFLLSNFKSSSTTSSNNNNNNSSTSHHSHKKDNNKKNNTSAANDASSLDTTKKTTTTATNFNSQITVMKSLSLVFADFCRGHRPENYDGASRAAWGCLCESKKTFVKAQEEYLKNLDILNKREEILRVEKEELDKFKEEHDCEKEKSQGEDDVTNNIKKEEEEKIDTDSTAATTDTDKVQEEKEEESDVITEKEKKFYEKMRTFHAEKNSNEYKWKDVQSAYHKVLEAISNNRNELSNTILRPDMIPILTQLELILWCPISETFAPLPTTTITGKNNNKGHNKNHQQERLFAREFSNHTQMHYTNILKQYQKEKLGFVPSYKPMHTLVPNRIHFLQSLSKQMFTIYSNSLKPPPGFYEVREKARYQIEQFIQSNGYPNSRVILFGSIANGFGSPESDMDMCLSGISAKELEDITKLLEAAAVDAAPVPPSQDKGNKINITQVDSSRIGARIPIIKFVFDGELECDISIENPLAVLNTSFLRSYSYLDPRIPILAAIIKKWAKRRDINNPSHSTLSSYGYLLMLIHFLVYGSGSSNTNENNKSAPVTGIIPNLLYADPRCNLADPKQKDIQIPRNARKGVPQYQTKHPTEYLFSVDTYFYKIPSELPIQIQNQILEASNHNFNQSIGYLLMGFFRYYAHEFDYEHSYISLHQQPQVRGANNSNSVNKQYKFETDVWPFSLTGGHISSSRKKLLMIEDPFETFYDVAHPLKQSSFQRIRKEFVRAFTVLSEFSDMKKGAGKEGDDVLEKLWEDVKVVVDSKEDEEQNGEKQKK